MSGTTVHRLGPDDVALAARVAEEVLGAPDVPVERLMELLADPRTIVLVAHTDDEPAGYLVAYCFPSLSGERLAYLYDIEVKAGCRRQGVARSLVHDLLSVCRAERVESIWVGSSLTNIAACELWRTTGAHRDGDQYVEFTFELDDA